MIRPGDIEATARAYNAPSEIIPGVAHNSMLERRWQNVAERILVWLVDRERQDSFHLSKVMERS
jgi:hypothetical protein